MEATIKNFDNFVRKLWEESSLNFLNSINPNPFDFLDNLDDIVIDYLDDGYGFHSYFTIRKDYGKDDYRLEYKVTDGSGKIGEGWELVCSDLTFQQIETRTLNSKMIINGLRDNQKFKDLVDSGSYRKIYRLNFYPNNPGQKLSEIIDNFHKPIIDRLENEFNVDQIYTRIISDPDSWVIDDISELKERKFPSLPSLNRTGINYITTHIEI
jgi:hypothetical protein